MTPILDCSLEDFTGDKGAFDTEIVGNNPGGMKLKSKNLNWAQRKSRLIGFEKFPTNVKTQISWFAFAAMNIWAPRDPREDTELMLWSTVVAAEIEVELDTAPWDD